MSVKKTSRANTAYVLLVVGLLFLLGGFANSGWRSLAFLLAALNLSVGAVLITSVSIVEGVPWLVRRMSRSGAPVWVGETLHADGGRHKVRYDFDSHNQPRFVAHDICSAIGRKVPNESAIKCEGIPLLRQGEYNCFSEANVQAYLAPLAIKNRAANRLLIDIRNEVLRKLEKQREQKEVREQVSSPPKSTAG